jgi:hypothetical protein
LQAGTLLSSRARRNQALYAGRAVERTREQASARKSGGKLPHSEMSSARELNLLIA